MPARSDGIGRPPSRGLTALPVHPFLVAAFPVLFLFAENAVQQVTLDPLWQPLAIAVAGALVLFVAAVLLLRDWRRGWRRGALFASLLIALFFSFGHVWRLLGPTPAESQRDALAGTWLVIALVGGLVAWRGGPWVLPLTRFVNVVAIVLVAFNVVRLGEFAAGVSVTAPEPVSAATSVHVAASDGPKRDIYYVILDRYSNEETLQRIYGYDNGPFIRELERRGFVVAHDAWANYFKTALSLTSSLSMDYLDGPALEAQDGPWSFEPLHKALRGRLAVPATLKSLGYEYVHIANDWEPTATNVDADHVLRFANGAEFSNALLATTAWSITQPIEPPSDLTTVETDMIEMGYREMARAHTLYQLDRLDDASRRPGPTYVFAHLLLPHTPWRFNADGSFPSAQELATRGDHASYLQQVEYANARILAWLDRVLAAPEDQQPIVILQADEGQFPDRYARDQVDFDWLSATPDEIQWKFGILNAVHLPGVDARAVGFTDRTSPVNEFRIVFNAYFGADLPLLPDRTYLSPSHRDLYGFHLYERP